MNMRYAPEERDRAIAIVLDGLRRGVPLAVLCAEPDMPSDDSVRIWAQQDPELGRAIARARESGWDQIAMDALLIADDATNDTMIGDDGRERANSEWIARSRLRVDTRLKLLAKWDPKRYGEMMALAGQGGGPIQIEQTRTIDPTRLTADQREALREILLSAMRLASPGQEMPVGELIDGRVEVGEDGDKA